MTLSVARKTVSAALLLLLALGLSCALQSQKAFAATTITEVGVTVDFDAIPMNCATTGNEANEAFKANRGLDDATKEIAKLDYMYSFVAEKVSYGSKNQILRKRLAGSNDLMTATDSSEGWPKPRQYVLVFNLIQKEGYEFPAGEAKLPVTVKVNGEVCTDVQVDRYNTDSVDVYVPIDFDSSLIVDAIAIDPGHISMKQGTTRQLLAVITGSQEAELVWSVSGNKSTETKIDPSSGELTVSSSEPDGNTLTVKATFYKDGQSSVEGICTVDVINKNPTIDIVRVAPANPIVDVSDGNAKSIDFKVNIEGTADHDWTYEVHNAKAAGTEITNVTADGFTLNVSGREPSGAIRIIVTSAQDPTKTNFNTVTVTGVHRVDEITLNYNTDVFYVDNTRTPKEVASYINFDNITYSGLDTYVDFTRNNGETIYSYIMRRAKGKTGWGYPDMESMKYSNKTTAADMNKPFDLANYDYFLMLNVDNREKGFNTALWPNDLESITVTANGEVVGENGFGYVDWYSKGETGSVMIYIPLGAKPSQSALQYRSDVFAPGVSVIAVTNVDAPMASFRTYSNVPQFQGNTMYYDFARGVWCYLVMGAEPVLRSFDFTTTEIAYYQGTPYFDFEENHRLYYTMTGEVDVRGDVNGSGKVNIVDAQVAYDIACGNLAPTKLSMKRLLMCDVNGDEYVDAADAFAIQSAALTGAWG